MPVSFLDGLFLSQSNSDAFHKPRPGSRTILATIDFFKAFDLSSIPLFFTNLFLLASLFALLVGLNLSFLIGALVWFFKITKVASLNSVEALCKDPFLAPHFSLFSSVMFLFLSLFPSAVLFKLAIWPFGPPPTRSCCDGSYRRRLIQLDC